MLFGGSLPILTFRQGVTAFAQRAKNCSPTAEPLRAETTPRPQES